MELNEIKDYAKQIRFKILDRSFNCNKSSHIGGALSMVEILATLYSSVLKYDVKNTTWEDRDRFILSKGHAALGFYSTLNVFGFIDDETFATYQINESDLTTHPVLKMSLGIESSNGSLGQGLSLAIGLALAAKRQNKNHKVYVLLGDGECNEGAVWEGAMAASNYKLDNLIAIVDNNGYQNDGSSDDVMDHGSMQKKWESFGWNAIGIDGHSVEEVHDGFHNHDIAGKPKVLVAKTVKGKGVSFMENNNDWHHNRLTKNFYETAMAEWEGKDV